MLSLKPKYLDFHQTLTVMKDVVVNSLVLIHVASFACSTGKRGKHKWQCPFGLSWSLFHWTVILLGFPAKEGQCQLFFKGSTVN